MLFYAPAGLRRWRKVLTPMLAAILVLAFVVVVAMPAEHPGETFAIVGVGIVAAGLLMLLLNGDPLPQEDIFKPVVLDPETVIAFPAHVSESSAVKAYREFWMRSLRELRFGTAIMPPVSLLLVAVALAKSGEGTTASFFLLFAVMSILSPLGLYLKGRGLSKMQARALPIRTITLGREGIAIGSAEGALAWSSVARVWEFDEHLTLVLHPLVGIQIPKADIPAHARDLIAASTPPPS